MKLRKLSRLVSIALVLLILLSFLITLTACNDGGKDQVSTFSYWMARSESTEYYLSYNDNPVMNYILKFKTFKDKDGKDARLSFEIKHPPIGQEVDNYNTMMSTGSYTDIIDLTYGGDIEELYNEGIILDLTTYVETEMPNFKKYIDAHPELYRYLTKDINGERKFLSLTGVSDVVGMMEQFYGVCYRRDWIVKYGVQPEKLFDPMSGQPTAANPKAGQPFSGYYSLDKNGNAVQHTTLQSNTDGDSWVDDVVFPSGNTDPIYISDWEWMFEIFTKAIADQNIEGGYCMSLYFPGYVGNGDLVNAFGGGGPSFYVDREGKAQFGAASDDFKTYLEAMNSWYEKGWIDSQFAERNSDVFFRIDETSFRQGKVGLWNGLPSNLDSRLYNPDHPFTDGIVVFGAPHPINDIYGGESQKLKIPYCAFQNELLGGGIAITETASEKDIILLVHFIDYLYSDEGALLRTLGLSKEQMAEAQDAFYKAKNLNDGAYSIETRDGVDYYLYVPQLQSDESLRSAASGRLLSGRNANAAIDYQLSPGNLRSRQNWVKYPMTGFMGGMRNSQLSAEATQNRAKVSARLEAEYLSIIVPQFIKGEKSLSSDWDEYLANLKKRNYQSVIDDINEMLGNS